MDPLAQLNDVIESSFAALGARAKGSFAPVAGPNLAQWQYDAPTRNANILMTALGPLGDAGMSLGEMMRTGNVDSRDIAPLVGNVLLGTMAPGGIETAPLDMAASSAEHLLSPEVEEAVGNSFAKLDQSGSDIPTSARLAELDASDAAPGHTFSQFDPNRKYYTPEMAEWEARYATALPELTDSVIEKALAKNPGASIFDIAGSNAGNTPVPSSSPFTIPSGRDIDYSEYLSPLDWDTMQHDYSPASFEDIMARERARQLGFNVEVPLFKGGTMKDYPSTLQIPASKDYERGLFFSDKPQVALQYTRWGGVPLEYVARAQKPMTIDWPSATGMPDYSESQMNAIIEAARGQGADLLHVGNIRDIGGKQSQYIVLDPSIVRAPSAQFDPSRLSEAAPLAGIAGLAAGTGLFFDDQGNPLIAR